MNPADRPKKHLGQHFLKDPNTARIVAAGVTEDDVVLEVGPGRGFLTGFLAERARLVHAVELDPGVLPALKSSIPGNVVVHEGDALLFDYASLEPAPNKLVANLPYNVASPLILKLLEDVEDISVLRFMVQLEVARRMAAGPGGKDYGAYAALVQLLTDVRVEHKVSPNVFDPPPRVRSAVVRITRRETVLRAREYAGVKRLVLAAFRSRRKRLVNNLPEPVRGEAPRVLISLGHGPDARAEELAPEDFVGAVAGGRVRLRAFAKVNYALEVRGVRTDGYHDIRSVMQSVSLADEVEIEPGGQGFELRVEPEGTGIGPPEKNTVYRAWTVLRESTGEDLPARVRLRKRIPAGAGLAGGSADAAATLVGLCELFGLRLDEQEVRKLGLLVGADVPFCLLGGTALGEGVGEELAPFPPPPAHHMIVVKPERSADTGAVYRLHDELEGEPGNFVRPVVEALRAGDLTTLARSVGNDLAPVTEKLIPEVAALRKRLLELGALGAGMTGSGTAVYGIFESEIEARSVAGRVSAPFFTVREPVRAGVEVLR